MWSFHCGKLRVARPQIRQPMGGVSHGWIEVAINFIVAVVSGDVIGYRRQALINLNGLLGGLLDESINSRPHSSQQGGAQGRPLRRAQRDECLSKDVCLNL